MTQTELKSLRFQSRSRKGGHGVLFLNTPCRSNMEKYFIGRSHDDEEFLSCTVMGGKEKRVVPIILVDDGHGNVYEYLTRTRFEKDDRGSGYHMPDSKLTYWFDNQLSPFVRQINPFEVKSKMKPFADSPAQYTALVKAFFEHFKIHSSQNFYK